MYVGVSVSLLFLLDTVYLTIKKQIQFLEVPSCKKNTIRMVTSQVRDHLLFCELELYFETADKLKILLEV